MEKLLIFVRSSIVKHSFKAVVLSFFLIAAFLFSSCFCFADFSVDTRAFDTEQVRASAAIDLGAAFVLRAALGALTVDTLSDALSISPTDIAQAIAFGGGSTLPPAYTYNFSLLDFLSRETIRIRPDSVTIGGVEMSDVWLPHDCADKFRTNAFDFITRYNIASETNGTFVSGAGYLNGIPVFLNNGVLRTQNIILPYNVSQTEIMSMVGSLYFFTRGNHASPPHCSYGYSTTPSLTLTFASPNGVAPVIYFQKASSSAPWYAYGYSNGTTNFVSRTFSNSSYSSQSFDFEWVSANIPSNPLPFTDGLRLRVPSSYVSALPQILDPESSSYSSDLNSLIESLTSAASADEIESSAFEEWDPPVPGSGTIADEPYSSLSGSLSGIQSIINSISTSVSGIAESIVGADSTFFGNIVSALATPFEPVFAVFRSGVGIWRYVVSWIGTISAPFTWSLSALGSAGSYFLSPIYATAAAAVVLAVYKKFGR